MLISKPLLLPKQVFPKIVRLGNENLLVVNNTRDQLCGKFQEKFDILSDFGNSFPTYYRS